MEVSRAVNLRTGDIFADHVDMAKTLYQRTRGLLGRTKLKKGQGLFIPKCSSIHTFFMRFSIDVLFLDKKNTVTKIIPCLVPFRIEMGSWGSKGVLELQCGLLKECDFNIGDMISFPDEHKKTG